MPELTLGRAETERTGGNTGNMGRAGETEGYRMNTQDRAPATQRAGRTHTTRYGSLLALILPFSQKQLFYILLLAAISSICFTFMIEHLNHVQLGKTRFQRWLLHNFFGMFWEDKYM